MLTGIIGYIALFTETENHQFFVEFPDLPGCFSQGDSMEEALCSAQEGLAIYYAEKNGELPSSSSFASIQKANPDAIVQMVAINVEKSIIKPLRAVKKTLTIPEWLNTLSEKYHVNFSQLLRTALINHLSNLDSISLSDKQMLKD